MFQEHWRTNEDGKCPRVISNMFKEDEEDGIGEEAGEIDIQNLRNFLLGSLLVVPSKYYERERLVSFFRVHKISSCT